MNILSLFGIIGIMYASSLVPMVDGIINPVGDLATYNSESVYVYNLTDDRPICGKNIRIKRAPASLVKIMTSHVALEQIEDLSEIAPIDQTSYLNAVNSHSSMAGFYSNEGTTYRDLLYGTMLPSGGECANSLAINISGDMASYVRLMNQEAKAIGLENTAYQNAEGLDAEGQYTTAEDVCKLIKHCLTNQDFKVMFKQATFTSTQTINHPDGLLLESTVLTRLDDYPQEGFTILGGKSGTTEEAGLCWATLASKNDKLYIIVVMGVPFDNIYQPGNGQIEDTIRILQQL